MDENLHQQFFQNRQCKFFPCHQGVDEADFNCLFCYCPLYALGKKCGGNGRYTENGIKSCAECVFPHRRENYGKVIDRYGDIAKVVQKMDQEEL